jgi:hypothetical protein
MELLSLAVGCSAAGTVRACEKVASRTRPKALAAAQVARSLRRELDDDAVDMITSGWVSPPGAASRRDRGAKGAPAHDRGVSRDVARPSVVIGKLSCKRRASSS